MGNVLYELTFDWYDLFDTLSIVVFFEMSIEKLWLHMRRKLEDFFQKRK